MSDVELQRAVELATARLTLPNGTRDRLRSTSMLASSATWYATELGWRVFPLVVGGKVPLTQRGFHDASRDQAVVRAWWKRWPQANIGTPTGEEFDAIDIDAPDGFATWADIDQHRRDRGLPMPEVIASAHTGGGGRHLLIAPQGPNGTSWGRGVDYRGRGGYIVLPPSRLDHGGIYTWVKSPTNSPRS